MFIIGGFVVMGGLLFFVLGTRTGTFPGRSKC
jgi:hypothetical protein